MTEDGWLRRFVDVRRDELPAAGQAFVALLLIITAHTVLETARDALLLTRLPPGSLGIVYVAVAACVLPAAAVASRLSARFGARRALGGGLLLAAGALVALFVAPTTPASVVGLYVASGMIGAVVVPQFWSLVGSFLTVAQARRLLGPIAAAGVVGASLGSTAAAGLLSVMSVKGLLLVAAGILVTGTAVITLAPRVESRAAPVAQRSAPLVESPEVLRDEPFLRRIALLVVVSTAAALAVDYLFKWTVAHRVPVADVAPFVARYYAVLNGLSLVTQIFVSGALVRRLGVATAVIVTPLLLALSAVGALASGGALAAVLILRATDGALLNSVHRVTTELVYLPVPQAARARAKPFIDGALARATQAACGGLFLLLGSRLSPTGMATVAALLTLLWLAVAVTTRGPYLGLLRRALSTLGPDPGQATINLESATALVQLLAHDDPLVVLGAMNALARRGRERLVPALVLLHEDEGVVVRALTLFAESDRDDWIPRARRLLVDPRGRARMAAARALATHGRLEAADLAQDASPRVQGYVTLNTSLRDPRPDPADDPALRAVLERTGATGEEGRLGVLSAIADAPRDARLLGALLRLTELASSSREWTEGLARAATAQQATVLVPDLIARLPLHDGREAVRDALAALGAPALAAVWRALRDPERDRSLRIHLPKTIARFATRQAAEMLLECIETDTDGLVRYKAIRGLQRLVVDQHVTLGRVRVERLAYSNLLEHFRLLGLRAAFEGATLDAPTERLLVRLLDDKLSQSLERTLRLLQIAHPSEDIRRVRIASTSADRRARANAGEFFDALLSRRDQRPLSALLRLVTDDGSLPERAARAAALLPAAAPIGAEAALEALSGDADATVAALARLHVATLARQTMSVVIGRPGGARRPVELEAGAASTRMGDA